MLRNLVRYIQRERTLIESRYKKIILNNLLDKNHISIFNEVIISNLIYPTPHISVSVDLEFFILFY